MLAFENLAKAQLEMQTDRNGGAQGLSLQEFYGKLFNGPSVFCDMLVACN